jgi:archaellum component FlaF (FlaF/FlaG flagellin family)
MAKSIFLIALLLALVFNFTSVAYAQEAWMELSTSKGTLDIRIEPTWNDDGNATFKVSFFNPGTDTLHEHQDYDFRILKDEVELFSAARQTGQTLIHNVEGTITVPYKFQENGDYTIQLYLAGTGIAPTIPTEEIATFPIQVTPEFPVGALGVVAALMTTAIVFARRRKI